MATERQTLVELLNEQIESHHSEAANYCWWCHRNINGIDGPQEPHQADCWLVRTRSALAGQAASSQEPSAPVQRLVGDDLRTYEEVEVQPASAPGDARRLRDVLERIASIRSEAHIVAYGRCINASSCQTCIATEALASPSSSPPAAARRAQE